MGHDPLRLTKLITRGFQFTQKLEGMFTDMRISAEGVNSFRNYQETHEVCNLHLDEASLILAPAV